MKVKVKKLNDKAVIPFKVYDSDLCYDVAATSEEEIAPNVWKYGTGLAFQIERGNEPVKINFSIDIRPRSSVWKTGMILVNSPGTVDEHYTGEVFLIFYHMNRDLDRYHVGEKIGQIKLGITMPIEFEVVKELNHTDRDNHGFGHTGLKINNI